MSQKEVKVFANVGIDYDYAASGCCVSPTTFCRHHRVYVRTLANRDDGDRFTGYMRAEKIFYDG